MNSFLLLGLFAILCGAAIAVQASTNTVLFKQLDQVIWVAISLFGVGLVYLLSLAAIFHASPPKINDFLLAPLWAYAGGIIVASYVVAITYLAPKLGVVSSILFIVFGQIVASLVIDHFGLFGLPVISIDWKRLSGCVFMVSGILLAKS